MKAQGVRRGVPDLMLPVPVAPYAGLFIEFKAEPPHDAPLTPEQREWLAWLRAAGYRAERACGCQQALELIESYLASARGVSG